MLSCILLSGSVFLSTPTQMIALNEATNIRLNRGMMLDLMSVTTTDGNQTNFTVTGEDGTVAEILSRCVAEAEAEALANTASVSR
jgi:hypothetical protein